MSHNSSLYGFLDVYFGRTIYVPLFKKERGMEFFHDVVDWVGGYPYEFATAEEVRQFFERLGFKEENFFPAQVPTGCNEFVFQRIVEEP